MRKTSNKGFSFTLVVFVMVLTAILVTSCIVIVSSNYKMKETQKVVDDNKYTAEEGMNTVTKKLQEVCEESLEDSYTKTLVSKIDFTSENLNNTLGTTYIESLKDYFDKNDANIVFSDTIEDKEHYTYLGGTTWDIDDEKTKFTLYNVGVEYNDEGSGNKETIITDIIITPPDLTDGDLSALSGTDTDDFEKFPDVCLVTDEMINMKGTKTTIKGDVYAGGGEDYSDTSKSNALKYKFLKLYNGTYNKSLFNYLVTLSSLSGSSSSNGDFVKTNGASIIKSVEDYNIVISSGDVVINPNGVSEQVGVVITSGGVEISNLTDFHGCIIAKEGIITGEGVTIDSDYNGINIMSYLLYTAKDEDLINALNFISITKSEGEKEESGESESEYETSGTGKYSFKFPKISLITDDILTSKGISNKVRDGIYIEGSNDKQGLASARSDVFLPLKDGKGTAYENSIYDYLIYSDKIANGTSNSLSDCTEFCSISGDGKVCLESLEKVNGLEYNLIVTDRDVTIKSGTKYGVVVTNGTCTLSEGTNFEGLIISQGNIVLNGSNISVRAYTTNGSVMNYFMNKSSKRDEFRDKLKFPIYDDAEEEENSDLLDNNNMTNDLINIRFKNWMVY